MTALAYHVGQILYHRASGERAIVVEVRPGVVQVSADVNRFVEFHLDGMPLVFSTEPVVVPSGFYPIEKPTEPGWYWWKAKGPFAGPPMPVEVRLLDGKIMLPLHPKDATYYGPKIPTP